MKGEAFRLKKNLKPLTLKDFDFDDFETPYGIYYIISRLISVGNTIA